MEDNKYYRDGPLTEEELNEQFDRELLLGDARYDEMKEDELLKTREG